MIVRWSLRILLALFLALVVTTGFAYWIATRTSLVEEQVNAWLDSFLSSQWPVVVSVGDIGGEPWRQLRLTDVRVDEIRGDSLYPLLVIDTIEVEYLWRNLLGQQWHLKRATLAGVRGRYEPPAEGRPFWWSEPDTTKPATLRLPQVKIERLDLRRVSAEWLSKDTLSAQVDLLQASLNIGSERITVEAHGQNITLETDQLLTVDTLDLRLVGFGREWFADHLLLVFDSTRIEGTAHVDTDSALWARATLTLDPVRWNDLSRWIRADLPGRGRLAFELQYESGILQGRGTVHGEILSRRLDAMGVSFHLDQKVVHFDTLFGRALGAAVEGKGRLDAGTRPISYGLMARLGEFDLRNLVPGALSSDLSGYFDVAGRGTSAANLRVDVVAESASGMLSGIEFSDATGALTVTTDSLYLHPGFVARYLDLDLNFGGAMKFVDRIAVSGDVRTHDLERLVGDLGFPGAHAQGQGRFVLTDQTKDPTLTFDLRVDSLRYKILEAPQGRVFARLAQAFRAPTGRVSGRLAPLSVGGLKLDSTQIAIDWSPEILRFDTIAIHRQADSLFATARFDPVSRNLTIDRLHASALGKPVHLPWPAEFTVGVDTLFVHNLSFSQDSGSVTANGWLIYGGRLNLTLAAADARLGPWLNLFYPGSTLDGKLFAELRVEGTSDQPLLDFRLRMQETEYKHFALGDLLAEGQLSPQALRFDSVVLLSGDGTYRASGELPLQAGDGAWKPDRTGPLSATLSAEGRGLRLIGMVLPEVESLRGTVKGRLTVEGTLDDPQFEGHVLLTDGDLKVWSLREHFSPSRFELNLEDSVATLTDVRMRVQDESRDIVVGGRLIFHGLTEVEYDLTARGTDIPLSYEYADFTGRFDVNVWVRGTSIPLVGGRLGVREAYYGDPLEATDSLALVAEQVAPDTLSWNVNLDVSMPNGAWVKNDDVNVELSGDLRVIRERGQWNYLGRLEPLRGSYYLFGRKFRNLRGSIIFDDVHDVDPVLDLEADVNLPFGDSSEAGGGGITYHEVTVKVQGRLSEPQIIPPSSMGQTEFLRALYPLDNPESGAGDFITGELERFGTRTLGVETFEVRPAETGRYDWSDARLRIGTYLLPDIYVYGGSSIDPAEGTEYGFEYRLKNWLRLQGHRGFDNMFEFDLNLKLEADK